VVAHILGLRLRLLVGTFRRSVWQSIALALAVLYGLGFAALGAAGLAALRFADAELARSTTTVFGSLVVLGFLVAPLIGGTDDALDPRRFALFPLTPRRLTVALAIAALVSVPSLVIVVLAGAQVTTWTRGPGTTMLALLSALLIVVTAVLGARVTTALSAFLLATRRAREATSVLAVVVVLGAALAVPLLSSVEWGRRGVEVLGAVASVFAWTPFGAAWAVPGSAAAGEFGAAVGQLLVALATVVALCLAWAALVPFMLVAREREQQIRVREGLGLFARLPGTPAGVIAARSLLYWARDARYRVSWIVIPIIPLLVAIPLAVVGVGWDRIALLPVPLMALFLTWSIHNDVAYDHTALWQHVAAHTRGVDDRIGRLVPPLLLGTVVVLAGSVLAVELGGVPEMLPAVLGVSVGVLLSGLGVSSVTSALMPYPAVRPGDNPFTQPQASGTASGLIQSVSFVVTLLFAAPAIWFAVQAVLGDADAVWLSLGSGLVLGVIALVLGVWGGAKIFDRRMPELMAFALRN
jgi:ABC-2 type transport system permease protein